MLCSVVIIKEEKYEVAKLFLILSITTSYQLYLKKKHLRTY